MTVVVRCNTCGKTEFWSGWGRLGDPFPSLDYGRSRLHLGDGRGMSSDTEADFCSHKCLAEWLESRGITKDEAAV